MTRIYTYKYPVEFRGRQLARIDCDMKGCTASVEAGRDRAGWIQCGTPDPKYKDLVLDLCPVCAAKAARPKFDSVSMGARP